MKPSPPTTSTGFRLDDGQIEVVDPFVAECQRKKTFFERMEKFFEANRTMRLRIAEHLRTRHTDWSEGQIQTEVARRWLHGPGEDLLK